LLLNFKNYFKKRKGEVFLKRYEIKMDSAAADFYETIARRTGTSAEKLMASVLFKFAGELSVKAILENIKGEN
jgi:transposase